MQLIISASNQVLVRYWLVAKDAARSISVDGDIPCQSNLYWTKVSSIAALDVGVILGIPVVLTVGIKLYVLQTKALEAQMKR